MEKRCIEDQCIPDQKNNEDPSGIQTVFKPGTEGTGSQGACLPGTVSAAGQPSVRSAAGVVGQLTVPTLQRCNRRRINQTTRTKARRERNCPGGFYPLRAKWL